MPRTPTWDLPVFSPQYRQWQEERDRLYRMWMEPFVQREEEAILRGGPAPVPEAERQIRPRPTPLEALDIVDDRDRLRAAQQAQREAYHRHLYYNRGMRTISWTPLVDESATMRPDYLGIPRSWVVPAVAQPVQPSLFELQPPIIVRKTYGTRIERRSPPTPAAAPRRRNRRNPEVVNRLSIAQREAFLSLLYGGPSIDWDAVDVAHRTAQADRTSVHVPVHSGEVLGGDQHGERGECPSGGTSDVASVSPGRIIPPVREG
jgi:hypothetical protein